MLKKKESGENIRVNAAESGHQLLTEIYQLLLPYLTQEPNNLEPAVIVFKDSANQKIHVAYHKFKDSAGLEWINVVAIPGKDFMEGISNNVIRTTLLAVLATVLVIITGLWILHWVTTDLKTLSVAVNRVGSGFVEKPIDIQRRDEIGDLAKSFSAMQRRLQTDYLTGLPNRYAFEQYLQSTIDSYNSLDTGVPFALLFIDLNDFKLINDHFGHDSGDQALIEVALRLRTNVRQQDFVARYAGDEFVAVLANVESTKDLAPIREKIEKALAEPLRTFDSSPVELSAAVGEAHFPDDADNAADLLIIADRNMYKHKAALKKQL